jgi:hypothetical protein
VASSVAATAAVAAAAHKPTASHLPQQPPSSSIASDVRVLDGHVQSLDPLASSFAPALFVRRVTPHPRLPWQCGPFYATQMEMMLVEQLASQARGQGFLDGQHGLVLDVVPWRRELLRMTAEQPGPGSDKRRRAQEQPPRRRTTPAATVALQLVFECELQRLLATARSVHRHRPRTAMLSSPSVPSASFPSLSDLRDAWLTHQGTVPPF